MIIFFSYYPELNLNCFNILVNKKIRMAVSCISDSAWDLRSIHTNIALRYGADKINKVPPQLNAINRILSSN